MPSAADPALKERDRIAGRRVDLFQSGGNSGRAFYFKVLGEGQCCEQLEVNAEITTELDIRNFTRNFQHSVFFAVGEISSNPPPAAQLLGMAG